VPLFDSTDRQLLRLAGPAFLTLSAEPIYVLVDNAIVGHISTAALGGLAIAGTILSTISWLIAFLATGITTQVAQRRGAGDERGARDAVSQGIIVALALGLGASAIVGVPAHFLARLLGGKGDVLSAAITYLRISALGLPAIALALLATGWFRGVADLRTPVRVVIGANIANLALEMLFVWGFHWGIAGSAAGTVIVQWAAAGVYIFALRHTIVLQRVRFAALQALLKIGGAMLVRTGFMVTTVSSATWLASRSGETALGAHQIGTQVYFFFALMVDALAISSQSVFAAQFGRKASDELWPIAKRLMRLGLIAGALLGALLVVMSPWVGHLISNDPLVVKRSLSVLLWCALMQLSGAMVFVLDGILMGADLFAKLAIGAFIAAAAFWIIVGLFEFAATAGLSAVWLALNVWMVVRLAGNYAIARRALYRNPTRSA
jgi:putative MATE family efflux protein